jgi:hypothetical protein
VSMIQEAKVVDGDACISAQKAAKTTGWGLAVSPALITEAGGVSAGTAVAARSFFGMVGKELDFIPNCFRSRICCSHVGGFCRGGLHVISLYMWCTEGLSKRNLDLLQCVAQVIAGLCGPWVLAADFNVAPDVLAASGWLSLVRGKIVACSSPTCGINTYDYFVVAQALEPAVVGTSLVSDAGFHPHSPARLFLQGRVRSIMKRAIVAPRRFDAYCPAGCLKDPSRFGQLLLDECIDIDAAAKNAFDCAEAELIDLCGLDGKDAVMASGRARGPRFVMKPALGIPGSSYSRCSRITAAWDSIASWLRIVLLHWGADFNAAHCHLPTLQKTRWRLCFYDWSSLGSCVHAKALRWWVSNISLAVLRDKARVFLLHSGASKVSAAAHMHDECKAQQSWRSWLTEGPCRGIGAQHRMSRTSTGWISSPLLSVAYSDEDDGGCIDDVEGVTEDGVASAQGVEFVPVNLQQAVDGEADSWATIWQADISGNEAQWPADIGGALPDVAVHRFRAACMTFPSKVGLGWVGIRCILGP